MDKVWGKATLMLPLVTIGKSNFCPRHSALEAESISRHPVENPDPQPGATYKSS